MKKLIIVFIGLLSLNHSIQAQIEPMYGMYRFNALVLNPSQAGANRTSDVSLLSRWQWTAIDGAPKTHCLSLNMPFRQNLGFGVNLVSDNIGPVSDFYLSTDYAYQLAITKKTKLSAGLRLSVINHRVDLVSRNLIDKVDESFKTNLNSGFRVNPGLGFLLMNPKYFIGFSMPRLLKYSYGSISDVSQYKDVQHSFIYGGYVHRINREVVLRPSVMANMSVNAPLSFDANITATFRDILDAGLVYRNMDAIGILLGYKFNSGLYAGYSYEYPISDIRKVSYMTHELALRFAIKDYSNKRILTPRYFN